MQSESPLRILIVDDDEIIRTRIGRLLKLDLEAVELGEAGDADSALRMAAEERWNLVLLDISFPGKKSGFEILKELRNQNDGVPVVIVSSSPAEQYRSASLAAGANAFVEKGRLPEELRDVVWSLVPKDLLPVSSRA